MFRRAAIVGGAMTFALLVALSAAGGGSPGSKAAQPPTSFVTPPSDLMMVYLRGVVDGNPGYYSQLTGVGISAKETASQRRRILGSFSPTSLVDQWPLDPVTQTDNQLTYHPVIEVTGARFIALEVTLRWSPQSGWFVAAVTPRPMTAQDWRSIVQRGAVTDILAAKPVIYLYPQRALKARVILDVDGTITASDPPYDHGIGGWDVEAAPTDELTVGGRRVNYLFWEARAEVLPSQNGGFLVANQDVGAFLSAKLTFLGLNASERAAFIDYWSPRMKASPYCLVSFAGREYTDHARLRVEPAPDTMIRVFMFWRAVNRPVEVEPQRLDRAPVRRGFVVVEWGGSELR